MLIIFIENLILNRSFHLFLAYFIVALLILTASNLWLTIGPPQAFIDILQVIFLVSPFCFGFSMYFILNR